MIKVLFVCLGNICRSPVAQGLFEYHIKAMGLEDQFDVDSAGTSAYHAGEAPDRRSQATAERHGIVIKHQKSRPVTYADFGYYDYIIPMDTANYNALMINAPASEKHKIRKLMDYTSTPGDVPDPYEQGPEGFERVHQLIEKGVLAFIKASTSD